MILLVSTGTFWCFMEFEQISEASNSIHDQSKGRSPVFEVMDT